MMNIRPMKPGDCDCCVEMAAGECFACPCCGRADPGLHGDFGEALAALKDGQRVQRAGWNGKGMWLAYMPGFVIPAGMVNERTRRFVQGGDLTVGGYLVIWTVEGVWQPGWVASQADMLADDWQIVPPAQPPRRPLAEEDK